MRQNSRDPRLDRRTFLAGGAGALALAGCQTAPAAQAPADLVSHRPKNGYLFALGVASGEPLHNSVVLWTRLAPDPLNGGGMGPAPETVRWEIAEDEAMRRVVHRGTVIARAGSAHSVHVEAQGHAHGRDYSYPINPRGEASPVGRTRTAPAPAARVAQLRFAVASCQDFQNGYYSAYRHLAREDVDFVLHLGD
jgi:alkaline phosphatase D